MVVFTDCVLMTMNAKAEEAKRLLHFLPQGLHVATYYNNNKKPSFF